MSSNRPAGAGARIAPAGPPAQARGDRTQLRLHVDWVACEGRGVCLELLPELLDEDPWGYPMPAHADAQGISPSRGIAVPGTLRREAERAVAACPRSALRLEQS